MPMALARKYAVQVSTDNTSWVPLKGINDLKVDEAETMQGADTYDSNGFNQYEKTLTNAKLTVKLLRPINAGVYDPGQELLRAARFQFGAQVRIYVRWYDRNGSTDAYSMYSIVSWTASKTAVADVEEVTVALQSDGTITQIANPYLAAVLPVVTLITPSGAGTGQAVAIQGTGFAGATGAAAVKFGGTAAASYTVQSDQLITAVLPTGSAGVITVSVTTPAGTSTATNNYTRAA